MKLPQEIENKIDGLTKHLGSGELSNFRQGLTEKYKTKSGTSKSLIGSKKEAAVYALSRMPATYAVQKTLIGALKAQGLIKEVSSIIDVGSGTGADFFALKEEFSGAEFNLFERDENMISVFSELSKEPVAKLDIVNENLNVSADLVVSSYVLSEIENNSRKVALKKLLDASKKYVLIVDTGTPKVYSEYMELKSIAKSLGAKVVAPCMCGECSLENDYCQFYARVERSAILRQSKSATLSYEDEKYFYLLFEKNADKTSNEEIDSCRVIRRPVYKPNLVELTLCTKNGVKKQIYTKKNKEVYKLSKKVKINDIF